MAFMRDATLCQRVSDSPHGVTTLCGFLSMAFPCLYMPNYHRGQVYLLHTTVWCIISIF